MTPNQLNNFYQKIENLHDALEAASNEESDFETYKILKKIFGNEFPEVVEYDEPISQDSFSSSLKCFPSYAIFANPSLIENDSYIISGVR